MTHNKTWLYIEMNIKITIKAIVIHRIYTSYTQKLSTGYSYPQQYAYLSTAIPVLIHRNRMFAFSIFPRKNDSIRAGRNSRKSLIRPRIAIRVCVCVYIRKKFFKQNSKQTNKKDKTINKQKDKTKKTKQTKKEVKKTKKRAKQMKKNKKKKDKKKVLMIKTII